MYTRAVPLPAFQGNALTVAPSAGVVHPVRLVEDTASSVRTRTEHLHHLLELFGHVQVLLPATPSTREWSSAIVSPEVLFATRQHRRRVGSEKKRDPGVANCREPATPPPCACWAVGARQNERWPLL